MVSMPCIRCGKDRILLKAWKEKSEKGNPISFEQYVCPDKDCQKIVDDKFEEMRQKKLGQGNAQKKSS